MIVVLILYGFIFWLSAIAYAIITDTWPVMHIILAGPFIISSAVVILALADYGVWRITTRMRVRRRLR